MGLVRSNPPQSPHTGSLNRPGFTGVVCPDFDGGRKLDSAAIIVKGGDMARRGYPPEFRRRVVDLVEGGRKVSEVATELEVSEQTIYTWRRQARIDAGLEAGVSTSEQAELAAAKRLAISHPPQAVQPRRPAARLLMGRTATRVPEARDRPR